MGRAQSQNSALPRSRGDALTRSTPTPPSGPIFITDYHTREIRLFPDSSLRVHARDIAEEDFEFAVRLSARMRELVSAANALGLAATQVGCALAVFAYRQESGELKTAINPTIEVFGEHETANEGCLSLGPLILPVTRPRYVRMHALDENGEEFTYEAEALYSRVIQHEHDHLRGRLILDATSSPELLWMMSYENGVGFKLPE
jgi:peptide deformylase